MVRCRKPVLSEAAHLVRPIEYSDYFIQYIGSSRIHARLCEGKAIHLAMCITPTSRRDIVHMTADPPPILGPTRLFRGPISAVSGVASTRPIAFDFKPWGSQPALCDGELREPPCTDYW